MATIYHCTNPRRREVVAQHGPLNGIDFLEVLDTEAPAGSPRQRTLLVRCLREAPDTDAADPIGPHNVAVRGGVRTTGIGAEWIVRADRADTLLADGQISADERDLFVALPRAERVLVVRTTAAGDFSTYHLALVAGSGPYPGFDAILAGIDFAFKVECPSDFDCAPDDDCPEEPESSPALDYLSKDYASFRRLMLDRMAVVMPDWQERSAADMGIAVVEVLAYAADHLSYYQDAVATEAYLGTARRRTSVRRHARLLDYAMHDGCNARTWVHFAVEPGGGADGLTLPGATWHDADAAPPPATRLLTRIPGAGAAISTLDAERRRREHRPEVFELMHDLTLTSVHNELHVYTWGDEDCCLPRGATSATLRACIRPPDPDDPCAPGEAGACTYTGHLDDLAVGDVLIFEAIRGADTGAHADADPTHRHAVRLTSVAHTVDPVGGCFLHPPTADAIEVTQVGWDEADALPFPLCISKTIETDDGPVYYADMAVARGNVALADHGARAADETLGVPAGTRPYAPHLAETGVTQCAPYDAAAPASLSLVQDPRRALPALRVEMEDAAWRPRRDLLDSDRFDLDLVAETESDGRATLRFGDDVYGRRPTVPSDPEEADAPVAAYRLGGGTAGNVGAEALRHAVVDVDGLRCVRNPLPARGGVAPEALDVVRLDAPQAFRVQERAVTAADYAEVAGRHPDVQRAVATRRWTGSWHTMFVTVDRRGGREVDAAFERELRDFLTLYELAGHDVEVDAPRFVALELAMTVCVEPGHFRSDVRQALLEAFSTHERADGTRGFFHPDRLTFGQPVYLSRIVARAMQVPGVRWVDVDDTPPKPNRFQRWGEPPNGEIASGRLTLGRLEIARLDNDPNRPENGRLQFILEGGL